MRSSLQTYDAKPGQKLQIKPQQLCGVGGPGRPGAAECGARKQRQQVRVIAQGSYNSNFGRGAVETRTRGRSKGGGPVSPTMVLPRSIKAVGKQGDLLA